MMDRFNVISVDPGARYRVDNTFNVNNWPPTQIYLFYLKANRINNAILHFENSLQAYNVVHY